MLPPVAMFATISGSERGAPASLAVSSTESSTMAVSPTRSTSAPPRPVSPNPCHTAAAGGALLEDLITRSFVMNQLHKIGSSKWVQLVVPALIFALYHTIWGFNVFSFAFSLVYGIMLGGLFLWGKRSLTPVILAHSLAVLISEPFATMLMFLAPGA